MLARLIARGSRTFDSQAALLRAVRLELHQDDPLLSVGGSRLRTLLVIGRAARLSIAYSTRKDRRPLEQCPVCGGPLRTIRNRTLDGGTVDLGRSCPRCGYWTHGQRRVPSRYTFQLARGGLRRPTDRPSG